MTKKNVIIVVILFIIGIGVAIAVTKHFSSDSKISTTNVEKSNTINKTQDNSNNLDNSKQNVTDNSKQPVVEETKSVSSAGNTTKTASQRESMIMKIESMSSSEITDLVKFDGKTITVDDLIVQLIDDFDPNLPVYAACGEGKKNPGNGWLNGGVKDQWSKWEFKKNSEGKWVLTMPVLHEFNLAQVDRTGEVNYCMIHYFSLGEWYKDAHHKVNHRVAIVPPGAIPEVR